MLYLCAMKSNLQILTAAILALGGMILLFCGVYIEPKGQLHETLLVAFGEIATFAGALFGIDAAYSKKLWEFTNSKDNNQTEKPSEEQSTTKKEQQ